jgi:hypothetical protein
MPRKQGLSPAEPQLNIAHFEIRMQSVEMVSSDKKSLPPGYIIHDGYPSVPEYLHLRSAAGLSPKTPSQATAIPTGSWYGCYITFEENGSYPKPVGMGRIIGDGGWYCP